MMTVSTKVAPPKSLVAIGDPHTGEIPRTMGGAARIAYTDSCVVVGCLSEMDGETEFTLGPSEEVNSGSAPAFEGTLLTPNRKLAVFTVFGQTLLEIPVAQEQTIVRVWVNDPREPDKVVVGVG
jgi:hypothetical protein